MADPLGIRAIPCQPNVFLSNEGLAAGKRHPLASGTKKELRAPGPEKVTREPLRHQEGRERTGES